MTAKEVLYTKCKKAFFSPFEEVLMLEAMEDYKNQQVKTLEGVIEIKEKERREWADMCIKKQAIIDDLNNNKGSDVFNAIVDSYKKIKR